MITLTDSIYLLIFNKWQLEMSSQKVLEEEEKSEDAKEYDEKKEDAEAAGNFGNDVMVSNSLI